MTCRAPAQVLTLPAHGMLWPGAGHAEDQCRSCSALVGASVDQCRSCRGLARTCRGPVQVMQRTSAGHAVDRQGHAADLCRSCSGPSQPRSGPAQLMQRNSAGHAADQCRRVVELRISSPRSRRRLLHAGLHARESPSLAGKVGAADVIQACESAGFRTLGAQASRRLFASFPSLAGPTSLG